MSNAPAPGPASPSSILGIYRDNVEPHPGFALHVHAEPALLSATTATLTLVTATHDWLVPPGRGIWIPAHFEHSVSTLKGGEASGISFHPERCTIDWAEPTGVPISPLLRQLIAHLQDSADDDPLRQHAEALLLGLLHPLPTYELNALMPKDPRARAVAERLLADPADSRELAAWAIEVHASVRTLSRLFVNETSMTFASWRTRLRLRAAVTLLAGGASVSSTAHAVGYRKPSAFITAFRRVTGQTPGAYLSTEPTGWPIQTGPASRGGDMPPEWTPGEFGISADPPA